MLRIDDLYEECTYAPWPGWTIAAEDERIFSADTFGRLGDAWATIITVLLVDENSVLKAILGRSKFLAGAITAPVGDILQLRVCSPSFQETDSRFLRNGSHVALVQKEFDLELVKRYCQETVQEFARLKGPKLHRALEQRFHVFDPDDD
jgi:hypothetical protein